ncbi:MAG: sigma-70 family RNA polymerase sigma factor [Gemmataceae bacterium]
MHADPDSLGGKLLAGARAGDTAALGELLERFRVYLTILARIQIGRRLQGKVDAADLVQDTFLHAHQKFAQFEGATEDTFLKWLRGILANEIAHLVRRYFSQGRDVGLEQSLILELDSSSERMAGPAAPESSPSEQASRREQALRLADALERLPADYREVLLLRQIEDLPFADVAQRMNRTLDSVQKLWVRALDALRKVLEPPP